MISLKKVEVWHPLTHTNLVSMKKLKWSCSRDHTSYDHLLNSVVRTIKILQTSCSLSQQQTAIRRIYLFTRNQGTSSKVRGRKKFIYQHRHFNYVLYTQELFISLILTHHSSGARMKNVSLQSLWSDLIYHILIYLIFFFIIIKWHANNERTSPREFGIRLADSNITSICIYRPWQIIKLTQYTVSLNDSN